MTTPRIAQRNASQYVGQRLPFQGHGSLAGDLAYHCPFYGRLPDDWCHILSKHFDSLAHNEPGYVVTSYGTPIAWWTPQYGWIAPDVKYSVSTGKQQSYTGVPFTTLKEAFKELRASGS